MPGQTVEKEKCRFGLEFDCWRLYLQGCLIRENQAAFVIIINCQNTKEVTAYAD